MQRMRFAQSDAHFVLHNGKVYELLRHDDYLIHDDEIWQFISDHPEEELMERAPCRGRMQ